MNTFSMRVGLPRRRSRLTPQLFAMTRKCCTDTGEQSAFVAAVLKGQLWPAEVSPERAAVVMKWKKKNELRRAIYESAHRAGAVVVKEPSSSPSDG